MIGLTNNYKIILFIILLISCNDTNIPTISNQAAYSYDHTMYLYGYPATTHPAKHNVYLGWRAIGGDLNYSISFPEFNYQNTITQTIDENGWGHLSGTRIDDINYNPGYYFIAYVQDDRLNRIDSFLVKTKEIDPIEDILIYVEPGGYDDSLTFTHSSDVDIVEWDFYHFEFDQNNADETRPQYFDISNPESGWKKDWTPTGWWGDAGWGTNRLDYYIYSKDNVDDSFCYMIRATDEKNFSRDSYIECGNGGFNPADATWAIDEAIISITNNLRKRIILEWKEYTNPDFYQYIIWRSEDKNMSEDLREKLNVVIESNQTTYYDSKGQFTPNGKTWYYMIEVQNQYGKSEFSEIKSGTTMP